MPGDRREQQPGRERGPRRGARRVDAVAVTGAPEQGPDEDGGAEQHARQRGEPEPRRQTGQRRVVHGVGDALAERDAQPLQPAPGPGDEHAEQRGRRRGGEAGTQRHPPSLRQREQQYRGERGLERDRDAVEDGREDRAAAPLGDPARGQTDEQDPVDLAEHEHAVQWGAGEHQQERAGRDRARKPQLAGDGEHGPGHHEKVSPAKIRYAVRASNVANGVISTVSSGGLRLVSFAGVS